MQSQEIVEEVNQADIATKKKVLKEALETASNNGNATELLRAVVNDISPDVRRATVAAAVGSAHKETEAQDLVTQALNAAHADTAQAAVEESRVSPQTLDRIWMLIVRTFAYVLGGSSIALVAIVILDIFYEVELAHVQIMLTMFTTVAGILAGFITGQAVGSAKERSRRE